MSWRRQLARHALPVLGVLLLYGLAQLVLILLGFLVVAWGAWRRCYRLRPSQEYENRVVLAWAPRWMWLWGNEEDGIDGAANGFWQPTRNGLQIFDWSAWRNSVGNARWTHLFGTTAVGMTSLWCWPYDAPWSFDLAKEGPYVLRQGWRGEIKFCWNPMQPRWEDRRYCWLGWRLKQAQPGERGIGVAWQVRAKL